jgi:3-deoxy-alpha-D-manno-octulosonate 8-oxidase
MVAHKNFRSVGKTVFGRGSFNQLDEILSHQRKNASDCVVFLLDNYFKDKPLKDRIPLRDNDMLVLVDVDEHEPTTEQVDRLRDDILFQKGIPCAVVGIGGGSVMDIAKAVALMLTNEGPSTLYQGLNLIKRPGVYHLGVPTLSGTGAEVSMTAVLTGPEKKLGLKCEWTVFDQIVLDPELISNTPKNQWFYTGMDTFIHCIESHTGTQYNSFSDAFGNQSLHLCREVFLHDGFGQSALNDEKLMVASYMGGLSLTYSEVGICHALSYGLSFVFGTRHCIANCIIFDQLEEYYPQGVEEFRKMVDKNHIDIPRNLSKNWSGEQIQKMIDVSFALTHMWNHALGSDWKSKISLEKLFDIYSKM